MNAIALAKKLLTIARESVAIALSPRPLAFVGIASLPACERVHTALASAVPDFQVLATNSRIGTSLPKNPITTSRIAAHLALIILSLRRQKPTVLTVLDSEGEHHHRLGRQITKLANRLGLISICVQHGGTKVSSLGILSKTSAQGIATWSPPAQDFCKRAAPKKRTTCIGYPFSSRLKKRPTEDYVLLATCLHSEYGEDATAYTHFVNDILFCIRLLGLPLKIIPHPHDDPNHYNALLTLPKAEVLKTGIGQFYSALGSCQVLLTRASTAAEEAQMLGIPSVLYDTPPYGARLDYHPISGHGVFFCTGRSELTNALRSAWELKSADPQPPLPLTRRALLIKEHSRIV